MRFVNYLSNNTEFLTDFDEGIDSTVDLVESVGSTHLSTNTGLAVRDDGVAEANDVNTSFEHLVGELAGKSGITEHDRADGVIVGTGQLETSSGHSITEEVSVGQDSLRKAGRFHQHAVGLDGSTDERRSEGVGEEVRTRLLAEKSDDFLGGTSVTAGSTTHSLTHGGGEEVDSSLDTAVFGSTSTGLAEETSGVGFIDPDEGVVLVSEVADLLQRSDITIHGENTIGDNAAVTTVLGFNEAALEISHVHVVVSESLGLAETDTIDDGSVVQLVGDDGIFSGEESLEETTVGIEAGRVEDTVFHTVELGNQGFEFLVNIGGTADETDRGKTESMSVEGVLGSLDQILAVSQTEVVVSAEVEDLFVSTLNTDFSGLFGGDDTFLLESTSSSDGFKLFLDSSVELSAIGSNGNSFSHVN